MAAMRRLVAVLGLAIVLATSAGAQKDPGLAFARARHLRRGINLSMWYAQDHDLYNPTGGAEKLSSFVTSDDFRLVRQLGFDHVRVSIDPVPLIAGAQPSTSSQLTLRPEAIARLDATVKQLTSLGLIVVLDIHPEQDWKLQVTKTDAGASLLEAFWRAFALHYSAAGSAPTDPEQVYFEVLNEPQGIDPAHWAAQQAQLIHLIRSIAPRHTIIATGESWGGINGLVALQPLHDPNIIYSFHDYEPMEFTHQGANWSSDNLKPLRNVPYPSSPESVAPLVDQLSDPAAKKDLAWYGSQHWNSAMVASRIQVAVTWAKANHVPLWCGEFGVYRDHAPAPDRARWITDMRSALESNGVGWNMWDYQSAFGVVTKKDGKIVVDESVATALGLKP